MLLQMVSTKALEFPRFFQKKSLKYFSRYEGSAELFPILMLLKIDFFLKKRGGKQCIVQFSGASYFEIIVALLAEVVRIYMRLFKINVKKVCFQRPFLGEL